MIVVVDASVMIKWYVPEIHDVEAELLLGGQFELNSPELAMPEFGNIVWKKQRSGKLSNDEAIAITDAFLSHDITIHPHKSFLRAAINGANETGQTVYDWTYLSLAISLSCPFITADYKFYNAVTTTPFKTHVVWIENIPQLVSN